MKKFLLVIAVLVMSATAYAADTLTTFADMESTYVSYNVRYVWGWEDFAGGIPPYLFPADSIHFVSPSHSLRFPRNSAMKATKNLLNVPAVHGPGTYQVHFNVKVKMLSFLSGDSLWNFWVTLRGFCRDSNPGGPTTWETGITDSTLHKDTLWHILDGDVMTIVLKTGDSLRVRDTLSSIIIGANGDARDSSCVDDAYLTGTFTPNGVEEGPIEAKKAASGLRPGIYDLLGRRVDRMEHSGIYFVVRKDGAKSKVVNLR